MDASVRQAWTREDFFAWAEAQEERFEFDGVGPVAMTGGNLRHDQVTLNVLFALRERLRLGSCTTMGPNAGVGTVGRIVRYPDALVTCSAFDGLDRMAPSPVVLFEVISPTSGTIDRIIKRQEYQAVASVLRYVIVETGFIGLTVLSRSDGGQTWTEAALAEADVLGLPEIGTEIAVTEIYEGVTIT